MNIWLRGVAKGGGGKRGISPPPLGAKDPSQGRIQDHKRSFALKISFSKLGKKYDLNYYNSVTSLLHILILEVGVPLLKGIASTSEQLRLKM